MVSPFYTWLFLGLAAIVWPLGIFWTLSAIRQRMRNEQESAASRESAAFAWSEKRLLDIMDLYPHSPTPAFTYAQAAHRRGDWEEALHRYEVAIDRDPRDARGYAGAVACLRGLKRLDESDALLRRAEKRCRNTRGLLGEGAYNAIARKDWAEAARRWEMHRQAWPDDKRGYQEGVVALRHGGRPEEAEALAAEMQARFREQIAAEATSR